MKKDNRKIAIYSRKSKFTGKGESIENQIEMCKNHILLTYPDTDKKDIIVYEDEGFSGGNTNRPEYQKMLGEIRNNNIKAVVCYRLDRISRNVGDFANLKKDFDEYDVDFISISDKFDTSTPAGIAMMMMVSVFAQLERDTIAERIRDNMHELAKSGRWLGGITPTGYKSQQIVGSVTIDGKTRKAFKLDIIPDEAEIIKLIFAKFIETNSLTQTETYLLQQHIKTKNGKNYTRFSIKAILQNPVYMTADEAAWDYFNNLNIDVYADKENFNGKYGIMAYNKTLQKTGKANQAKDYDEWIVAIGKHQPIITSNDWIKVQSLLAQNSSKAYHKPRSNVALLSGLLYCGNCGSFMRPKLTKRINADGESIYSYLCEMKEKSRMHNCAIKNPNGNELDKLICDEIKKLAVNNSSFISELQQASKEVVSSADEFNRQLNKLKTVYNENQNKIKSLVNALSTAANTPAYDYINTQINELHEENIQISKQIEDLENMQRSKALSENDFDILRNLLFSFANSFDVMTVEEKRSTLRAFIKRIEWDGENAHVYLFGNNEFDNSEPLGADCK